VRGPLAGRDLDTRRLINVGVILNQSPSISFELRRLDRMYGDKEDADCVRRLRPGRACWCVTGTAHGRTDGGLRKWGDSGRRMP